jgi:hypothetical protein
LKEVDNLDKEVKGFRQNLLKICWHMRGSINIDQVYMLGYEEREWISEIIKENMETTKKSGLPFF